MIFVVVIGIKIALNSYSLILTVFLLQDPQMGVNEDVLEELEEINPDDLPL